MIASWAKDPAAKLDYTVSWVKWLESGDTITAHAFTAPEGIAIDSDQHDDTTATVWLSGGTVGVTYDVVCQITTSGGRIDERTIQVSVQDR